MAATKLPPSKGEPQNLKAKSKSDSFGLIGLTSVIFAMAVNKY
ncbi:hypothetical protein AM1_H0020 (plasmid) [Acaryochloris marina MBIC11017]|uniref:Uncharacterized protein n=1 Tax=Acaryochloris marina (strain MBIC 11017) TaxID=329726 RepID=A8ZQT7_ACAM1|nr:hypothetical protein AM1_H0020 [Acaryochloris marina MBIC11017]